MNEKLEAFKKYIAGKSVALIGAGISNMTCVAPLLSWGAAVCVRDKDPDPTYTPDGEGGRVERVRPLLDSLGAAYRFGDDYLKELCEDVIIKTPAVRYDVPEIAGAVARGAELTSEVGLFCRLCPCPIFAVTGSDGKTTTTTLIHKMLSEEYSGMGKRVWLGGNIGTPLFPETENVSAEDYAVLELSSFQLQTMDFSPYCAVVTNISPNHLNWHRDMDEYVRSKANIFAGQREDQRAVFNAENAYTASFAGEARANVTLFSSKRKPDGNAVWLDGDMIYCEGKPVMRRSDIRLVGDHNVENYMAAIAATRGLVSDCTVRKVAGSFGGVRHRLEEVLEKDGVRFYNSSIDTTPSRTMAALGAFCGNVILICGGSDKNIPMEPMIPVIKEKTRFVCATGTTGEKLYAMLVAAGYPSESIVYERDFDTAVTVACEKAKRGDVVLLSPAAASFDSFRNFEVRGNRFCELIKNIKEKTNGC